MLRKWQKNLDLLVCQCFIVMYGFDSRKHCVFDVMHMVALGVVRNNLNFLLSNQLLDKNVLQERLLKVPWTAEFLSS